MTVAQLIKKLKTLPQNLPIGSFQTHDQGLNEGNEYPWTFCEFSPSEIEAIKVAPSDEYGNLQDIENIDYWCDNCPEGKLCKACNDAIVSVVVIREGF